LGRLEQPLQKRSAPAASCPGAKAVGQLPNSPRLLEAKVILDLSLRNVKAKAKFVVWLHDSNTNHNGTKGTKKT
jgi:hypothetical protein